MGVSYSIIPVRDVQSDESFVEYINSIDVYGSHNFDIIEEDSRYPNLLEIYKAIEDAGISIVSENKRNEIELKKGKEIISHSINIKDKEKETEDDLTIEYVKDSDSTDEVIGMSGIKSDIRVLIKLTSVLSKKCGSYIILAPEVAYLVNKSK